MALKEPRRGVDRPLSGEVLTARLPSLLDELRAEEIWDEEGRNSRTVFKAAGLRVVLVALRAGAEIRSHKAESPLTLQVLGGQLRLRAGHEELALGPGAIAHLGAKVPHDLKATKDAAFLLTIGGSG